MPKVVIHFDPEHHEYHVFQYVEGMVFDNEYQVLVEMKASHYRNILRNESRHQNDRDTLRKFFVEAQMAGRPIREL